MTHSDLTSAQRADLAVDIGELYAQADTLGLPYEAGFADDLLAERVSDGLCVDGLVRSTERDTYPCAGCFACGESDEPTAVPDDTSEDPCTEHGYDECPDCGNAGTAIGPKGYYSCTRFLTCWADGVTR